MNYYVYILDVPIKKTDFLLNSSVPQGVNEYRPIFVMKIYLYKQILNTKSFLFIWGVKKLKQKTAKTWYLCITYFPSVKLSKQTLHPNLLPVPPSTPLCPTQKIKPVCMNSSLKQLNIELGLSL